MAAFEKILSGGDLRSIGKSNAVVLKVQTQKDFDDLFQCLLHEDRLVVMRAADAIEKITVNKPDYLYQHKDDILTLCNKAKDIELKWHLALLVSRLDLTKKEISNVWKTLTNWANDKKESRIVRVNSLQGLHHIVRSNEEWIQDFNLTLKEVEQENIPSINARISKLRNASY